MMLVPAFLPGKLLISFVPRHKGEPFVAALKEAGARGGTLAHGRAILDNRILQALSLADAHQDVIFTLMGDECGAVVEAAKRAGRAAPKKLAGLALVLDVAAMMLRMSPEAARAAEGMQTRSERMESGYTLLTVIVNNGYAEDVMAVARKAGARGGTILVARGTGTKEDVKFFGITLVPEKEVLMIVARREDVPRILDVIRTVPTLNEPGGGIVYSMNVEEFVVLGK